MLPDRIAEDFNGATVFITGGSGFLGKLLIERLLRNTNVKQIYLLIRNKKGKSSQERLEDIFSNVVFDTLRKQDSTAFKKCKAVPGDVAEIDLGISEQDRKTLQNEAEFIYHSAASTRFDDSLRVAVRMNTRGTKYMLDLAKQCRKLKLFAHISTAYAFPQQRILYEESYQAPADVYEILKKIDFEGADQKETEALLGDCPNTYTFSKALAEQLVADQRGTLPVIIARPSLVCPTYEIPTAGWCDNMHGVTAMFVGAGKGVIRSMYVKKCLYADFVAADLVISGLLAFSWRYLNHNKDNWIINLVGGNQVNINWETLIEEGKYVIYNEVPFNMMAWYPGGTLVESKTIHLINFVLFQLIPAFFIDGLLMILGYPPVLVGVQKRIYSASNMLEYYTTRPWNFVDRNLLALNNEMNERERKLYKTVDKKFDVRQYLLKSILGARRYLKETDDMIPAAKRNLKILWFVDRLFKSLLVLGLLYYVYKYFLI